MKSMEKFKAIVAARLNENSIHSNEEKRNDDFIVMKQCEIYTLHHGKIPDDTVCVRLYCMLQWHIT